MQVKGIQEQVRSFRQKLIILIDANHKDNRNTKHVVYMKQCFKS